MPKTGISYVGDWRDLIEMWWYDPQKEKELEHAKQSSTTTMLPSEKNIIDFWKTQD